MGGGAAAEAGVTVRALERGGGVRLAAFAGLSALAAWRYAAVEARPPTGRVVGLAAGAVVAAAALMLLRPREADSRAARARAVAARVTTLAVLFVVALLVAGVPLGLLGPARWGTLWHELRGGSRSLATTLWPYPGGDAWTRLDIMLGLAAAPLAAAALGFWPAAGRGRGAAVRHGIRQLVALGLLLTVYVIGVVDSDARAIATDGLLVLALVVAWLWLPGVRAPRRAAALAWIAAAGVLAVVLAGRIGSSQAWLDYRAWDLLGAGGPGISFTWDQSYGPITWSRSQRTMFTVTGPRAQLWKTTTLDRFDGLRFVRSGADAASSYQDLPLPLNPAWYRFATFTIKGLRSSMLPAEQGTTVGVDFNGGVRHDADGTARTAGPAPASGASYTILSYVPAPTPADLRAAPQAFPAAYLRYTDFDLPAPAQSGLRLAATDRQRPGTFLTARTVGASRPGVPPGAGAGVARRILASPYAAMYRLARRLAAGRRSSYDVAIAIQSYLRDNYGYSEHPPARRYPLESFLFADRAGYCQQFSGAMALMLRMDGIPARVAAGFHPGAYDGRTHRFDVRATDAHSWVEVYFAGIGWVPFDPTPPRSAAIVPRFPGYESERTVFPYAALAATLGTYPAGGAHRATPPPAGAASGSGALPPLAVVAVALIGLLAPLTLSVRWLRGRSRLRRSLEGDGELATRELVRALRRLGYAPAATVTLAQLEAMVRLHGGPEAARYVRLLRDRRYARGSVASATLHDRRRLRHGLTAHLGLGARARGLWALPPATASWRVRP
jgi:transglutaminase-like putative cysteine protease